MAATTKDTIYIDVDDEITSVIDKLRSSEHKIVALVLPKRASVFQSIVNMRLLKRTAGSAKKHVVLITSETSVLPLAGAVGLHVAKTLQSKPHIPPPPDMSNDNTAAIEALKEDDEEDENEEPDIDNSKSIGELAGAGAGVAMASNASQEETIDIGDDPADAATNSKKQGKKDKKSKNKKNKKLAVPNFDSFRKRLFIIGGAVALLIIFFLVGTFILPKAKITIKTDNASVTATINPTLSTTAKKLDESKSIVPATLKQLKKTGTEKIPTTGQKDVGTKASGTVKFYNCNKDDKLSDTIRTVPAGTVVSGGGLSFVTATAVTVGPSGFNGNNCKSDQPSEPVSVTAQNAGDKYNLSARSYGVSGFSTVTGEGSDMSGGTSKVIKIVSDSDINAAKQKINDRDKFTAKDEIKKEFDKEQLSGIDETISSSAPEVTSVPKVGEEASEVTITTVTTYSLLGVKKSELSKLLENEAKKQIDTSKQAISDTGLNSAIFHFTDKKDDNEQRISIQSIVIAGVQIDQVALKKEIAGKKRGDVQEIIQNRPNVKDVSVDYSPFWVYKTPRASRITIVFDSPEPK